MSNKQITPTYPVHVLDIFHPLVNRWFRKYVGTPTDIQENAWPQIASGHNVLVTAPTGSGKTLTAFLWAIDHLLTHREAPGKMRVLYISPLKALNNDIKRNLETPLEQLREVFEAAGQPFPEIRTAVRSGDTEPAERRRMLRHPPEIFITTPESLNILLSSKPGRRMLTGIDTVILDEIHAVFPTRRGTYLMTAIERLVPLCGEFQRIALSATVNPMESVADFIGGYRLLDKVGNNYEKRKVSIVRSKIKKKYDLKVHFPTLLKGKPDSEVWWPTLTDELSEIIRNNTSTLFFANSRRMVEKITRLINENQGETVYSHHGSLSKEIRSVVEKRFKDGELSAIIATSSLELGIDIGSVDQVVLIQAPYSISSAIQRIGRSGHGVGKASSGSFYPLHSRDLVESAVLASNIDSEAVEAMSPVHAPLDVLAQVILSMTVTESRDLDELFGEIRCSSPYHHLSRKEFDLVLQMLAGRYADSRIRELKPRLLVDRVNNTVKARENAPMLLFLSGGVIPDRGYYNMRDAETKAKLGELDEEFVWERSLGDAFPLGNQVWRIIRITHNDVEVSRVSKSNSLIPFWRADQMNRSFHLSDKIGRFLQMIETNIQAGEKHLKDTLTRDFPMSESAADALLDYLKRQRSETEAPLPHRFHILVEHFRDPVNRSDAKQTVLHTLWGGRVNRPLAFALAAAWEEKFNYPLEVFANNDCIMLNLPHAFSAADVIDLVKPGEIRKLLRKKLESTGYFGAKFRENAQRALLLPRQSFHQRMPLWLNRLRSKKLIEAVSNYDDFPVLLETWRECLNHDFEIDVLVQLLEEMKTGEIRFTEVDTKKPSPFADSIMWRQVNQYMYEDDSPHAKLKTNLSDALLKEVMVSSQLRPRFPARLLESFGKKLHRVADNYTPDSPDELLLWVKERLYIPLTEWNTLLEAMERDHEIHAPEITNEINDRLYWRTNRKTGKKHGVMALENLPDIHAALRLENADADARETAKRLGIEEYEPVEDDHEALAVFLRQWLQFYGPVSREFVRDTLIVDHQSLILALDSLRLESRVMIDRFREPPYDDIEEICESGNLEILLRLRRADARPQLKPLEIELLPLFLAVYQGVADKGEGLEDLQECLESMFGYPAKAGLWESDILPARLDPYYSSWLDSALRDNDLVWFGCGNEKVGFCFQPDYDLFAPVPIKENGKITNYKSQIANKWQTKGSEDPVEEENGETGEENNKELSEAVERLDSFFLESKGKYSLSDLMQATGIASELLTRALWQLTWDGVISNDHYKTVRNGVMNRFRPEHSEEIPQTRARSVPGRGRRRLNFNRWQTSRAFSGHWFALPDMADGGEEFDALDRHELIKDKIRVLFMRYGVLFRELLWNELPGLRWRDVFPVLRLMELSGEIVSGQFFKGIPGLQFGTPAVLGIVSRGLPDDAVFWINAADPVSPCGIGLETLKPLFPHRLPSTHLVFHGKKLVLVSKKNGKDVTINVDPNHPRLFDYLEIFKVLVGREFQPVKYVSIETINDQPVSECPYREQLKNFGFHKDYKSLTLVKKY